MCPGQTAGKKLGWGLTPGSLGPQTMFSTPEVSPLGCELSPSQHNAMVLP